MYHQALQARGSSSEPESSLLCSAGSIGHPFVHTAPNSSFHFSSSLHLLPTSRPARPTLPHLPRLEHLIAQQQITRNARRARDGVAQRAERVVYTALHGVHGLAEDEVQTGVGRFCKGVLEGGYC